MQKASRITKVICIKWQALANYKKLVVSKKGPFESSFTGYCA